MSSVDVSVIIPAYNRLWSLPAAVNSCRHTSCAVQIIVVDDGSTDGTWEWLKQQDHITAIKQANWGKCWAVNNAFEKAEGKYVRFLDSDDQLAPGAIDEQFKIAENTACDIVVSGYELVDENKNTIHQQAWVHCDDFIAQQLGECDSSHYSAYLFKKDFIHDIPHRPDFAFRDDRLFVLEAALKSPKVAVHNGFALVHTQHTGARLQKPAGINAAIQNHQHLTIYKKILGALHQSGQLTPRRVKAAINPLWNLCKWMATDKVNDPEALYAWIKQLDPGFKPREKGLQGILYQWFGVNNAHKLLKYGRAIKGK